MSSHGAAQAPPGRRPLSPVTTGVRFVLARTLVFLVVAGLALTAVGAVFLLARAEEDRPLGTPSEASVSELRALAEDAGTPIYWAGTSPGDRFEVTETRGERFFVRYLPPNVDVADERPEFLTVGTYPYPRAYAVTEESSTQEAMASASAPAGGLAVWSEKRPTSVYVAYPGSELLVEVFSPEASEARRLVLDGDVGPVDRNAQATRAAPPLVPPFELGP